MLYSLLLQLFCQAYCDMSRMNHMSVSSSEESEESDEIPPPKRQKPPSSLDPPLRSFRCEECGKTYANPFNLKRHLTAAHPKSDKENNTEDFEYVDVTDNERQEELESWYEFVKYWSHTYHKDKVSLRDALTSKELYKDLTSKLPEIMKDFETDLLNIYRGSFYEKMQEEQDRLLEWNYDDDEAILKAWKNRKLLVKKLITDMYEYVEKPNDTSKNAMLDTEDDQDEITSMDLETFR